MQELLDACRLLPLDGPPAPPWAEQYHHLAKPRNARAGAATGDDKPVGGTMTMTATMTQAYVTKLAEALNRRDNDGDEADVVLLPLSCPGIVNAQDMEGWTAVMLAAKHGSLEILKALIGVKADIDRDNQSDGDTALLAAVHGGHSEVRWGGGCCRVPSKKRLGRCHSGRY